jgi:hypothetical protein
VTYLRRNPVRCRFARIWGRVDRSVGHRAYP